MNFVAYNSSLCKNNLDQLGHALFSTPGDTNPVLRRNVIDYVVSKTLGQDKRPGSLAI